MKIERIMVAAWAERYGTAIRIVHVVPPKRWLNGFWGAGSADIAVVHRHAADEQARRERQLAELLSSRNDTGVERIVVRGDAVKHVFAHIRRIGASLVVLGQHARRKRRAASTTFGSVCRYVTTFSPTNVLVVPVP